MLYEIMSSNLIINCIKNIFYGIQTGLSVFFQNEMLNNIRRTESSDSTGGHKKSETIKNTTVTERGICDLNIEFLNKLIKSLSMDEERLYMAIPSLAFLICSLMVVYFLTHKRTFFIRGHTWKQIAIRELIFQWGYYYVTRLWLVFIKILKWADECCQQILTDLITYEIDWLVHLVFLLIYACVSLLPLLIVINEKFNRPVMPNFMVWVGAHRWERTELGMSGYYLDRPLRYEPIRVSAATGGYRSIQPAYRTRRSCSADHATFLQQIQTIPQQSSLPVLSEQQYNERDRTPIRAHHNGIGRGNGVPRLRYVRSMEYVAPVSNISEIIR